MNHVLYETYPNQSELISRLDVVALQARGDSYISDKTFRDFLYVFDALDVQGSGEVTTTDWFNYLNTTSDLGYFFDKENWGSILTKDMMKGYFTNISALVASTDEAGVEIPIMRTDLLLACILSFSDSNFEGEPEGGNYDYM